LLSADDDFGNFKLATTMVCDILFHTFNVSSPFAQALQSEAYSPRFALEDRFSQHGLSNVARSFTRVVNDRLQLRIVLASLPHRFASVSECLGRIGDNTTRIL